MRIGVVIRPDAEHAFVTDHSRPLRLSAADLPLTLLDGVDGVFLNGYGVFMAGSASFAAPLLAEARRRGILVAFDPSSFSLIGAYGAGAPDGRDRPAHRAARERGRSPGARARRGP